MSEPAPPVLVEATLSGTATITLNRPKTRNAFDAEVIEALSDAFESLHGADGIRIVFLRGAGGTFSAGADLEWMARAAELTEHDNQVDALAMAQMLKALWDLPALTVALIEGGAYGGGAGLAAACDLAFATPGTKFAFSEVKLGIIPAAISPYVVRAIGPRNARALFATGEVFDAARAERLGLISEVVSDLEMAARRTTAAIISCAPGAVAEAKALVDVVSGAPLDSSLMDETARRIAKARVSAEGKEGVRAFLERRKPEWALTQDN